MSGIMAIVSLDGRPVPPELPRAQLAAIVHRGEWEPRLWEAAGVALGHVNLPRTPEAEREFLPMSDPTGRYWLTWDGRLDNRDELGSKLGYDTVERSEKTDAAYVLDAFLKWGDDCVHHLLGDWAIVIWDDEARRLFCAKDPIGWRQLYYAEHEGLLAVGSEPQQFFANGWLPRLANEDYVLRKIAGASQELSTTCHIGVRELMGGRTIGAQGKRVESTFLLAPRKQRLRHRRLEDYVDEFEHLFDASLKARLRANGSVATMLSGGLDSSYIAAAAGRLQPEAAAYTTYLPGSICLDERRYADEVAGKANLRLKYVDASDAWMLSRLWLPDSTVDQPHLPGAGSCLRAMATAAKADGHVVLLGGEGGDEWLDGGTFARSQYRCVSDALLHRQLALACRLAHLVPSSRSTLSKLVAALADDCLPPIVTSHLRRPPAQLSDMVISKAGWVTPRQRKDRTTWAPRINWSRQWELYQSMVSYEVPWRDRHAFLGNKIESRSPFNDLRLIEFAASVPDWVKRFNGERRSLLRYGLAKHGVTGVAKRRDKGMFNELMIIGLADREQTRFIDGVRASYHLTGLKTHVIEARLDKWLSHPDIFAQPLYDIAVAGIWLSSFGEDRRELEPVPWHMSERREVISK